MTEKDIIFTPHSDMCLCDVDLAEQHLKLYQANKLSDATNYLDDNNYSKGFRASLFNNMENKLRMIQEHLLNKEDEAEEIISSTEPTASDNLNFWLSDY